MSDQTHATDFGLALREKREARKLSIRAAARQAEISEGRWRQLERGYQSAGNGRVVPVNPKAATVLAVAAVVGLDGDAALRLAGVDGDFAAVNRQRRTHSTGAGRVAYLPADWGHQIEAAMRKESEYSPFVSVVMLVKSWIPDGAA